MPAIHVMLVEDQVIVGKELRATLEKAGYVVTGVVASGEDALGVIERDRPDVILVDMVLRGQMNGIEFTGRIKRAHPDIAVIGLSMHSERQFIESMLMAGASSYVLKSCSREELVQAIEAAVKRGAAQT